MGTDFFRDCESITCDKRRSFFACQGNWAQYGKMQAIVASYFLSSSLALLDGSQQRVNLVGGFPLHVKLFASHMSVCGKRAVNRAA